jgi:hypothetical protein
MVVSRSPFGPSPYFRHQVPRKERRPRSGSLTETLQRELRPTASVRARNLKGYISWRNLLQMSWIIIIIIIIIRIFSWALKCFQTTNITEHVIHLPEHENTRATQSHISFPKCLFLHKLRLLLLQQLSEKRYILSSTCIRLNILTNINSSSNSTKSQQTTHTTTSACTPP